MKTVCRVMPFLICILAFSACATHRGVRIALEKAPAGHLHEASAITLRDLEVAPDDGSHPRVTGVVIGVGSGMAGFTSVELHKNGAVSVVMGGIKRGDRSVRVESVTTVPNVSSLLESEAIGRCWRLKRRYRDGIADGTQGFLLLEGDGSTMYTWCDNAFPEPFREAWETIRSFVESQPRTTWRYGGAANGYDAYRKAEASSRSPASPAE